MTTETVVLVLSVAVTISNISLCMLWVVVGRLRRELQ